MSTKDKDGFDISKAKSISKERREKLLKAAENKLGRPLKPENEKHKPISIKLHPDVYNWAQEEAKLRGQGYQTVINETLLDFAKKKKSS
jgi:uncharacterized protein (DUF4415 family)